LGDRKALQWATQSFRQDLRSYGTFPTIGVLERPLQNNAWRHADVNLLKRLKAFDPQRKDYLISDVHIADDVSGYLGNYEGVSFWLDNIKLRPVLGAADLRPTWSASDLSGVSDYRCGFNPDPSFTPVGKASPADVASLRDGPTWFHLMLCDGAGNWSAAAHEFVFLDVTPPEAAYFAPIWEMVGTFDIRFLELGGLDPRSVVVKVGPREYRVDGKQMWYNQGTQRLTWRAGNDLPALLKEARPREASAAPQTPGVEVVLLAARDYAGNAAKTPQSWWWRVSATPVSAPDESLPGPRLGPVPRRPR
jgi:hypothetical protein